MKIQKIERDENDRNVYIVEFIPNWFESLIGKKPYTLKYKDSGNSYMFGSGSVYYSQDGKELGNFSDIGKAIDTWRNRW